MRLLVGKFFPIPIKRISQGDVSIDWKFPMVFFILYVISCILFNKVFYVPGSISIKAILTFLLPYIGISSAIYIFKFRSLYLDSSRESGKQIHKLNTQNIVNYMVPILFLLQLATWIYILTSNDTAAVNKSLFIDLRNSSLRMESVVPSWLSYPNGLCFAAFCLSYSEFRCRKGVKGISFLVISVLTIFLNDLQSAARAGMAFVVFVFLVTAFWDWRVNRNNPLPFISSIIGISIFTQLPKVLRDGYNSIDQYKELSKGIIRYCFTYLNTLSELLERLPDPNWLGRRTFLPLYNLLSRVVPYIERDNIAHAEKSNVWGFNNYTMSGELLRDFSFIGCIIIPFIITAIIIFFASNSTRHINIAITLLFSGWLVYGGITNIFMLGGFFISIVFLFSISTIEKILGKVSKRNLNNNLSLD